MSHNAPTLRPRLPCPFCSAAGDQCHAEEVSDDVWTVICEGCGANGPLDLGRANTASRAVGDWDARVAYSGPINP